MRIWTVDARECLWLYPRCELQGTRSLRGIDTVDYEVRASSTVHALWFMAQPPLPLYMHCGLVVFLPLESLWMVKACRLNHGCPWYDTAWCRISLARQCEAVISVCGGLCGQG